ncbi:class I SAM-dependent methyltransferase [Pseudalkalibacillus berkeleyi]|uniref:Class I SAM-dependent methyltransferase n=1 Tax=Pseudalkalibacillus berkeleyi TaxID=1069813 RepID=A0ABS9GXD7_9BACL|nr:class I SAM-dependent methyltransferase [Pseudalkalibacillus berkeleyi]MCF6136192.1 class I SAM-dependent methyltransferase [Pseudalkalibacillus berkeleyi]
MDKNKHIKIFEKQAKGYEKLQQKDPTARFRKKLIPDAKGKVLEVAVGTGLNFPHYVGISELNGIDFSKEMLKAARNTSDQFPFPIYLEEADVETVEYEENTFDTIVSTLSFCSYESPVELLNRFQKWCKPNGRILMMEHGICKSSALGWVQKKIDPIAYKMIGCHQDRDITRFVNESNLQLEKVERKLNGFLYYIWARP